MKYLKSFNESEELMGSLDNLIKSFNRYLGMVNRDRLVDKGKLSDDFKHYFYDLTDDGWEVSISPGAGRLYFRILLINALKKDGIEAEVQNLIDRMTEIRDRFMDEGFDSKFLIFLNGKGQGVHNPDSYRVPIYQYTGIGDDVGSLKYYKDGIYSSDEYVYGRIEFSII